MSWQSAMGKRPSVYRGRVYLAFLSSARFDLDDIVKVLPYFLHSTQPPGCPCSDLQIAG